MANGFVQHITVEESTSIQWVKGKQLLLEEIIVFFDMFILQKKEAKEADRFAPYYS